MKSEKFKIVSIVKVLFVYREIVHLWRKLFCLSSQKRLESWIILTFQIVVLQSQLIRHFVNLGAIFPMVNIENSNKNNKNMFTLTTFKGLFDAKATAHL